MNYLDKLADEIVAKYGRKKGKRICAEVGALLAEVVAIQNFPPDISDECTHEFIRVLSAVEKACNEEP